jgi:protoporphyrinogen oxidase
VRYALFENLTRVKFELPCAEVSAAWLGARLFSREGSSPLGYIPGANWTKVLCEGVTRMVREFGVDIRVRAAVTGLDTAGQRIRAVELGDGERLGGDLFVSTVPTTIYSGLVPRDDTRYLSSISYTALISVVCATHQKLDRDFYWMTIVSPGSTASGIFLLNSLNPTIGGAGENVINFMTHLKSRDSPLFVMSDDELLARYTADFERIFNFKLQPFWVNITRVPMYSPIFHREYHNPPVKSQTWENLYFAGNYRTFPSAASTGTALSSGLDAGGAILRDFGQESDLSEGAKSFRPAKMPRG